VLAAYPAIDPTKVVTIRNGVDTTRFAPNPDSTISAKYGVTGRYAIFVGRITRQKGLAHLLRAWKEVPNDYGLVLAAGNPDEDGIGAEVAQLIAQLQKSRPNIWWIKDMLPQTELAAMLSGADLFICPSVYEPLGIVNLEAMACETAVLASRVGGIPEVVADKETGELVDNLGDGTEFETALTESITRLMSQPDLLKTYGLAGRIRAMKLFGWNSVAEATVELYRRVLE
jgi:starch synthase